MKIKFDSTHNALTPTLVLATRNGDKLGVIPAANISAADSFNSNFDLQFNVNKFENGVRCHIWDDIVDFKLAWCREWDTWFELYVSVSDDNETVKTVTGVSLGEAELSQIMLYNIEINTEDDIARDDYKPTVLFDEENPSASLLHRIMEKAPHYTVTHVDTSIAKLQRTFTFDGTSLYDAFQTIAKELDCIFVIDSGSNEDGSISRSIGVYDLEAHCAACGNRGSFEDSCPSCGNDAVLPGYGTDTAIFVSTENLADDISLKTDTDSVKNCFRLEGGDDLMTATIRNCNPNGSQYLWYISDDTKRDMSEALVAKLASYDESYAYYQNEYALEIQSDILDKYNALVTKYHAYKDSLRTLPTTIIGYPALMSAYYDTIDFYIFLHDELMPSAELQDTSAAQQAALLTASALSPVAVQDIRKCSAASASNAVLSVAKVIVDNRYRVKVKGSTFSGTTWTGNFTVTNYSDDTDTAESATVSVTINDDYETFVKQKLDKALSNTSDNGATDIASLFALSQLQFEAELEKYCLVSLQSFYDACRTCIDILIEQGVADRKTWADQHPDLYTELYLPYYNKMSALEAEMKTRENEIAVIAGTHDEDGALDTSGIQTIMDDARTTIQAALNFEGFLGTDLWLEFVAYRRESTYSNTNYISDGLNTGDLFDRALEFIEVARKEIYKSATKQHSLSASLKNLLVMREFAPITDSFAVGNWIRVKIDDAVYRLRLINYSIDFDDLDGISVEFSDVERYADGVSDSESVLQQAASMATTYDTVSRQAGQGQSGKKQLDGWVENGLALTKMKIVDNADNQNVTWDSHGLLCREYLPILDSYSDKQLKIINRGLYLTDDGWLTSKAGIGDFTYFNPKTQKMESAYGVIADTLIGSMVLSEDVGIYNKNNSITLNEDGLVITADATEEGANTMAMTVQRKTLDENGDEVLTKVLYLDANGNLVFTGSVLIQSGVDNTFSFDERIEQAKSDAIQEADRRSNSAIQQTNDSIRSWVGEEYYLKTETDEMVAALSTQITQTADSIQFDFQTLQQNVDNLSDGTDAQFEEIRKYIRFVDGNIVLGEEGNELTLNIAHDRISFLQSGTEVAYFSNQRLYVTDGEFMNSLQLGNFAFLPRANGNLSFKKVK